MKTVLLVVQRGRKRGKMRIFECITTTLLQAMRERDRFAIYSRKRQWMKPRKRQKEREEADQRVWSGWPSTLGDPGHSAAGSHAVSGHSMFRRISSLLAWALFTFDCWFAWALFTFDCWFTWALFTFDRGRPGALLVVLRVGSDGWYVWGGWGFFFAGFMRGS